MPRHLFSAVLLALFVGGLSACQTSSVVLKAGDCVNYQNGTDANGDQVENIAVVDCAQPHAEEAFFVFDMPGGTAFPGYEAIGAEQQTRCQDAFANYVGIEWEQSSLTIGYNGPTEQTWAAGDHRIACMLEDASGATLTGSAKDSAR
jgi:hypothetical protein